MNINMMQLVLEALEKNNRAGAKDLAYLFGSSVASIKKCIAELKDELHMNGADIISKSGRGNGYQLIISNEEKYKNFRDVILPRMVHKDSEGFVQKEKRMFFLATTLLGADDYLLSANLAEEEGISISQFSKELKEVKEMLAMAGVSLISVPHHGLKIIGSEQSIRSAYTYYLLLNEKDRTGALEVSGNLSENSMIYKIGTVLHEVLDYYQYPYDALTLNNILVHLLVMCRRIKNGNIFYTPDLHLEESWEYPIAVAIAQGINEKLGIYIPDSEVEYISIHLISKEKIEDFSKYQDIREIINNSLSKIHDELGYDLEDDTYLKNMLLSHTIPMLERAKYSTKLAVWNNVSTKEKFLAAESCAVLYINDLNRLFGIHLPYDEVWYCTLHFEVALKRRYFTKRKVLVVTGVSRANSIFIQSQIEMHFNEEMIKFDYVDFTKLHSKDLKEYNCILTTINILKIEDQIPIYFIPNILHQGDFDMIQKLVMNAEIDWKDAKDVLLKNDVVYDVKSKTKEEALNALFSSSSLDKEQIEDCRNRDSVRKYSHGKKAVVIQPLKNYDSKSFVLVDVFKNSVTWDKHQYDISIFVHLSKAAPYKTLMQLKLIEAILKDDDLVAELKLNPNKSVLKKWIIQNEKKMMSKITKIYRIS